MFNFICRKTLIHLRSSTKVSPAHELLQFQHHPLSTSTLKSVKKPSKRNSFIVSYLINSCGFTPERAQAASKYTTFDTPDRADSVRAFFKNHGFTETQVLDLVKRFPPILQCDPEKTLLPKLEFFSSIGLSSTELARILTSTPNILKRSLENQIIPSYNFLKNLLQSDEKAVAAIKRFTMILGYDLETHLVRNVAILQEFGVPKSNVLVLLSYQPRDFIIDSDRFRKIADQTKEMGFNPLRLKFVMAIHALRAMSKLTWEKKVDLYKKWGWSEDEIFVAFGKHPWCMMASGDKIMGVMDFLVNKMGWDSSVLAKRPGLISLSLEKRIIPRCLVFEVLLAKGLIKKEDYSLTRLLETTDEQFFRKISKCYIEEAPELLKLYQKMLDLSK